MTSKANTLLIVVLSLWSAQPFVSANGQPSTARDAASRKFHATFRSTPLNCECTSITRLHEKVSETFFLFPSRLNYSLLNDNQLGRIKSDGLFGRLPNLVKLDLRRNQISGIEPQAFDGALKIQEMLISENKMTEVHNKMFMGLHNLKTL